MNRGTNPLLPFLHPFLILLEWYRVTRSHRNILCSPPLFTLTSLVQGNLKESI